MESTASAQPADAELAQKIYFSALSVFFALEATFHVIDGFDRPYVAYPIFGALFMGLTAADHRRGRPWFGRFGHSWQLFAQLVVIGLLLLHAFRGDASIAFPFIAVNQLVAAALTQGTAAPTLFSFVAHLAGWALILFAAGDEATPNWYFTALLTTGSAIAILVWRSLAVRTRREERQLRARKLSGNVAHQLNNQLQSVVSGLDMAELNDDSAKDGRGSLHMVRQGSEQLATLGARLATIGGHSTSQFETIDLTQVLERSALASRLPPATALNVEALEPAPLQGDAEQLQEAFVEVLRCLSELEPHRALQVRVLRGTQGNAFAQVQSFASVPRVQEALDGLDRLANFDPDAIETAFASAVFERHGASIKILGRDSGSELQIAF